VQLTAQWTGRRGGGISIVCSDMVDEQTAPVDAALVAHPDVDLVPVNSRTLMAELIT
jgi:hypothetical protein